MSRTAVDILSESSSRSHIWARNVALVVAGSAFMALCARLSVPLPFTPVPLSLGNFGVLVVGLLLGSRLGFATLALYLAEGAMGLPVFSPAGPGGIAQLLGPTGGYLIAYPLAALVAGWVFEQGRGRWARGLAGALLGNMVVFAGGIAWMMTLTRLPFAQVAPLTLYPFLIAEVAKMASAAALAGRYSLVRRRQGE